MLTSHLQRFARDVEGTVQIIMVLAVPLLVTMALGVVELASLNNARNQIQRATDAATIAAVRTGLTDPEELSRVASDFINENLADGLVGDTVTITVRADGDNSYVGEAKVTMEPKVVGILGLDSFEVEGFTRVNANPHRELEIALVLDTTYSMTGDKMETLKTAASDLADSVMDGEQVKVSVVPFARYVNIGLSNRREDGVDVPRNRPEEQDCQWKTKKEKVNCRTETHTCYRRSCRTVEYTCTRDGVEQTCKRRECRNTTSYKCPREVCDQAESSNKERVCRKIPAKTWRGCVGSREAPYNARAAVDGRDVPGLLNVNCGKPLQRLTNDIEAVKSTVRGLTPNDETYMAPGLLWGWRTLTHEAPFADGVDPAQHEATRKVIVLMSDGMNTISKNNGDALHRGKNVTASDQLFSTICENVKKDGIEIFAVALQIDDAGTKQRMRECASDPREMFYEASDTEQLVQAFRLIANDLSDLYIAE